MITNRLQRFGRFRRLHTIISQETVKPSSPTPPHLKTRVFPLVDSINPHHHMPFVLFYKNYNGDIKLLKESLSKCLAQYYPLAGRLSTPNAAHIDCTDDGVEFLEASHDSRLDDFIRKKENDESLRQLVPKVSKTSPNLLEVQLNHFTGGGVAVALSTSHKAADAFTTLTLFRQWANVTRGRPLIKPYFISSSTSYNNVKLPDIAYNTINEVKYLNKSFVFPNSKLTELKNKVISMGLTQMSPAVTRVEVLISLLFKCSVDAATTKSGVFKPSSMFHPMNMRNKFFKNDPEYAAGNLYSLVQVNMRDPHQRVLNEVVDQLKKGKMEIAERDVHELGERWLKMFSTLGDDPNLQAYMASSVCRFPFYDVDFGWGEPIQAKFVIPDADNKVFVLMDTQNRDGIEATLRLPEEDMMILEQDKELLAYVDN